MKFTKKFNVFIIESLKNPKIIGTSTFLFLSFLFFFIAFQNYTINKEDKRVQMSNTLNVVTNNIEQLLKNCYTTTLSMALIINEEGVPEDFDTVGKKLLESNTSIDAVQMVPDGVIKYVYPLEGNEKVLGLDILNSKSFREEALRSIKTQKMYFAGPFELTQGGKGIVGRLPVYFKNKFWGFSAVIIRFDRLLINSGINSINTDQYYFQLSKINPNTKKEEFFLDGNAKLTNENHLSSYITDGDWKISIVDREPKSLFYGLLLRLVLSLLTAYLLTFMLTLLLKRPKELELLVEGQAKELKKSEFKFKTIFEQASLGIANVDINTGKFIEINEKFCDILGYTQEEMRDKDFQSITHPDDLKEDVINVEKIKRGIIDQYTLEKRYYKKNGQLVWVSLNVTLLKDTDLSANSESAISIVEDITLKKEREAIIKESKDHFKSLFDDSPLPLREEDFSQVKLYLEKLNLIGQDINIVRSFFVDNPEEVEKIHDLIVLTNTNKACLKLYKVDTIEKLLLTKKKLFNETSFNDFKEQIIAISQNYTKYYIDTVILDAHGEIRNIDLRWNTIRGFENTLERIIVSNEDITDRKNAEKIILDNQLRTQTLIDTIDGIVWECDVNTFQFTYISKKVEDILGYTSEEWISSKTFWQDHIYYKDKEHVINFCRDRTNENKNHDFEYRMVAKDGSIVWLREIVNVISENNVPVSLRGIMIDITMTKEIQKNLNNSFELVSKQNDRLLNFSYIVSHNLRSHTSNISSLIELIEYADDENERNEMLKLLKSVSISLNDTMLNLNEVVNIQTNVSLNSQKINLYVYVEATIKVLSSQIELYNIEVNNLVDKEEEIVYNAAYIESILFNLISNAIKYSHRERKSFITIKCYPEKKAKIIEISDNGIGIDLKKNENKIFGLYKTFSNLDDSKGIGLYITKNQVNAMGGTIKVESEPNVGTTFKILVL